MHRAIRKGLESAEGVSESVVAVNLDVRSFTAFAGTVDSVDVAIYLRRLYQTVLDDVFPDADFFKLTGDGLLLTFRYTSEDSLAEQIRNQVGRSLALIDSFGGLTTGDKMIYYEVPDRVGIGISRGSASRIQAGELVLDYTGRPLNTASRLMQLARPSGVVLDATIPLEVLPDEAQHRFSADAVYLAGIAEETPVSIWYTSDRTVISPASRRPIAEYKWDEAVDVQTLSSWKGMIRRHVGLGFRVRLPSAAMETESASVVMEFEEPTPAKSLMGIRPLAEWTINQDKDGFFVLIKPEEVVRKAGYDKLPAKTEITIRIAYRPK